MRHNQNQALLNAMQWDGLLEGLALTKPMADKEAAAPPPAAISTRARRDGSDDFSFFLSLSRTSTLGFEYVLTIPSS